MSDYKKFKESLSKMGFIKEKKKTKIEQVQETLPKEWRVFSYSPGDGITRYRFFKSPPNGQNYFGPENGSYTALGFAEAIAYARGVSS